MKILITGITGLLGHELSRVLSEEHEIIGLSREATLPGYEVHTVDISDQPAAYQLVTRINPDLVIHAAALSNVDTCERDPDTAYRFNALGTRNLALACQRFDSAFLYISTDYVFSGKNHPVHGYTEFDPAGPVNVYGCSKLQGESFTRSLLNRFYIIRTSWLFGASRRNFVTQFAQDLTERKEIKAVTDMVSAPTYVKDLAVAISILMKTGRYGIYHLTNSGFASRHEISLEIARIMKKSPEFIQKANQRGLHLPAARPCFSAMNNYIWKLDGLTPLRPWQEAVKEFLEEQKRF